MLRYILVGPVPAFHHDWNWPYLPVSFTAVVSYGVSPWLPNDLGAPNVYPTLLPLLAVEGALLQIFGTKLALVVLLLCLYTLAALGCYVLTQRLGASRLCAAAAGAFYVTAPALFVQLVAGHFGDIVVYAALPWLLAAFLHGGGTARMALNAAFAAMCCSVQPQGFVLSLVALTVCAVALGNRRAVAAALTAALAACASICATLYGLLSPVRERAYFIAQEHAVISWVRVQSAALSDAIAARGYFAGYDRLRWFAGVHPGVDWCFAALTCALLACAIVRRSRMLYALCVLYAIGLLTVTGLKGPLAGAWSYAFANVEAASLFRELFHAAPFLALPISVAAGVCCEAAWRRAHSRAAYGAIAAATALLFAINGDPALGGTAGYLRGYTPSAADKTLYATLSRADDASRFAVFPGRQPYNFDGSVGVDPLAYYPIGRHEPIFGYFPSSIVAFAADEWLNGHTAAALSAYRRMGVRYLLLRQRPAPVGEEQIPPEDRIPGLAVRVKMPASEGLVVLDADPLLRADRVPLVMGGDLADLQRLPPQRIVAFLAQRPPFVRITRDYELGTASAPEMAIAAGCSAVTQFRASALSADPADAWVDGLRYGVALPQIDAALFRPVLSTSSRPLDVPDRALLLSLSPSGRYEWTRDASEVRGAHVVAAATTPARTDCRVSPGVPSQTPPRILHMTVTNDGVRGSFVSYGHAGAFAFEENYDSGWSLIVDGRAVSANYHFVADGYANGWIVDVPAGTHAFAVRYAPAQLFGLLLIIQIVLWFAVAGGCALKYVI